MYKYRRSLGGSGGVGRTGGASMTFLFSRRSRALKASPTHSQSTLGLLARALGEGQQIDRTIDTKINRKITNQSALVRI